ncbi:hypothetical protein ABBQ32_003552 [Trebouxia sp. C0010 RCD-2024]
MSDVNFAMDNLPEVLGMVVKQLADQCASQEDLAKLTTTTTTLQTSVDTLGAGFKSVQELLQQLLETQRSPQTLSRQPPTAQRSVPRMPAADLPNYKPGPTQPSANTAVLKADLEGAIKDFGPAWVMAQKEHWPTNCYTSDVVKSIENGTYGNTFTTTGGSSLGQSTGQSHSKRGRDSVPANLGGDTHMRQAKQQRFRIQIPKQSRPTTQANGTQWFPLDGMVVDRDLPTALQALIHNGQDPSAQCLKSAQERVVGQC